MALPSCLRALNQTERESLSPLFAPHRPPDLARNPKANSGVSLYFSLTVPAATRVQGDVKDRASGSALLTVNLNFWDPGTEKVVRKAPSMDLRQICAERMPRAD